MQKQTLGLESPEFVPQMKSTWPTTPLDMTVIEYWGLRRNGTVEAVKHLS